MNQRRASARSVAGAANPQSWVQRSLVIALVGVSLLLLVLDQRGNAQVKAIRASLSDVTMPLVSLLSAPISTIEGGADWVSGVFVAHRENQLLNDENTRLKQWKLKAQELELQNSQLKQLLNVPVLQATHFVTARAVADQRGPFAQALMIDAGAKQNVALQQPVVGPDGLAGRIVEVNPNHSRVLLVSDINSRIAVQGVESGTRSLLVGKGHGNVAAMKFTEGEEGFVADEMLVTIASDTIPSGIPVATFDGASPRWLQAAHMSEYFRVVQLPAPYSTNAQ